MNVTHQTNKLTKLRLKLGGDEGECVHRGCEDTIERAWNTLGGKLI